MEEKLDVDRLKVERKKVVENAGSDGGTRKRTQVRRWLKYCSDAGINPLMEGIGEAEQVEHIGCFAMAVREGTFNAKGGAS